MTDAGFELIDSHCHLNYDYSPKSIDDIIREASEAGVKTLITIGVDLATLPAVVAVSEKFPNVYHTVGVHPHEASTMTDSDLAVLEAAAHHPKCRAVGEIGLDYHYTHSPQEVQKLRLEQQLELALRVNLPVVIHAREAEDDLLVALTAYAKKVPAGRAPGVIHCFSGTKKFGQACIDLGFYISFSGIITFKKADDLRECVREFPLDRILIETDSPYLAPVPFRGKKCEPAMVRFTAQKIAELKGTSTEAVATLASRSSRAFFRI